MPDLDNNQVIDTGHGFRWPTGSTYSDVEDHQVVAVRLKQTKRVWFVREEWVDRHFEVWIEGSPEPFCMTNRFKGDDPLHGLGDDPLRGLITRLIDNLKQRTATALASGAVFEGNDWKLSTTQLSFQLGKVVREVTLAEIDMVAFTKGQLRIWVEGKDEPAMKIDLGTKNAPVLGMLLRDWVEHRRKEGGKEAGPAKSESSLGRLLFRHCNDKVAASGVLCTFFAGIVGTAFLFVPQAPTGLRIAGIVLETIAVTALVYGLLFGFHVFRVYEHGVASWYGLGWKELRMRFDEMDALSYQVSRFEFLNPHAIEGGGCWPWEVFVFIAFERSPSTTIICNGKVKGQAQDLDRLRDHVAIVIASRMLRDFRQGKSVPWGLDKVFLPQGLQFRQATTAPPSEPAEVIPYAQIRAATIEKGCMSLFSNDEPGPVFRTVTHTSNFFPGFYLLLTLLDIVKTQGPEALATIGSSTVGQPADVEESNRKLRRTPSPPRARDTASAKKLGNLRFFLTGRRFESQDFANRSYGDCARGRAPPPQAIATCQLSSVCATDAQDPQRMGQSTDDRPIPER